MVLLITESTAPPPPLAYSAPPPPLAYAAPLTSTYAAPPTPSYGAPPIQSYGAPTTYSAPPTYSAPTHTHGAPPTQGYAAPPTQGYAAPPTQGYAAPQTQDYGAPMSYGYGAAPNHGYGYGPPSSSPYYPPYGGMMSPYGSPFGSPFGQGVTLSPRKMMMARMILAQDGLEQDEVVKILMMQHQDPWTMQEIAFVINIMVSFDLLYFLRLLCFRTPRSARKVTRIAMMLTRTLPRTGWSRLIHDFSLPYSWLLSRCL